MLRNYLGRLTSEMDKQHSPLSLQLCRPKKISLGMVCGFFFLIKNVFLSKFFYHEYLILNVSTACAHCRLLNTELF